MGLCHLSEMFEGQAMKPASEVAEGIILRYNESDSPKLAELIAQALTAFAEERVKEAMGNKLNKWPGALRTKASIEIRRAARAEAFEEAAKVVLKAFSGGRENHYPWVLDRAEYAANAIRALVNKN